MGLDPSGIIKEVARAVAGPVFKASKEWIDSVVDYDKNLTDVGDHRHQLENQRKEIEQRVQLGIMNNEVPVDEVNEWLTAVDALMASKDGDWEELLQDESTRKKAERSCIGLFWSPLYRHDLSTKAVEKSKEINDKMEIIRKRGQAPLTLETKHGFGESKSTFFCQGLQSREDTLKQILDALKDDKVNRVGVYGMGGAGKTTLMEELARRVDNMKLFSDIILVEISQFPNIRGIQDQLAGNIHFNLDQYHDTEVRAFNLGIRLKNIVNDNKIDEDSGKQGKDEKLLVILDNMWDKLDLQLIGIPYDLENDLRCKIIVTTRSDYVCKTMGIATPAVFNVGDLSDAEAKLLFRYKLGDILDIDGYKKVSEELLEKCSRLPLTITILGDTLRNQDLTVWKHILRQLENPIQGEIAGLLRSTYSIIELSYNNVGIIEKRVFFLLCCLSPQGSNVSIHTVFKYGIGMGLFQYVSSLTEAIDQVYKWVDDLKTLSLFKDFDAEKGDIVIHDDVRHAGKTFALREKHTFLIGSIPKWLEKDSYENLTAISMVFDNSYEYLGNQNMPKLQLLCAPLDTCSSKLDEKYFLGLSKLRVLDISKSKIRSLPSSLRMLQNLKTLLMEDCFFEDDIDITHIGQLGNIQVLSFRNSNITRLPVEIRSLGDLKMLDLTDCNMLIKIPADALTTITQLEGLYMQNSFCGWEIEGDMASLSELSSMCLNVLEIGVQSKEQLIDGDFPCLDLSSYVIGYSISSRLQKKYLSTFPRELQISGLHAGDLIKEGWRRMVTKAESLYLSNIDSLKNVAPYLSEYGLNEVRRMEITMCEEIECVVSGKVLYQSVGFPKLKTLWLESLPNLRSICHGRHPANLFFDLQDLRLSELNGLKNHALPIHHAAKLKILKVQDCENLKYVFSTSPSTLSMQSEGSCEFVFTCLKKLKLRKLPKFEGLCSGNDKGKHLFSRKISNLISYEFPFC